MKTGYKIIDICWKVFFSHTPYGIFQKLTIAQISDNISVEDDTTTGYFDYTSLAVGYNKTKLTSVGIELKFGLMVSKSIKLKKKRSACSSFVSEKIRNENLEKNEP